MGLPAIRANGLPGNRFELYREGIKAMIFMESMGLVNEIKALNRQHMLYQIPMQ